MDPIGVIALIAGGVMLLAILIAVYRRNSAQRTADLRDHFGPEYERALHQHGGRSGAERELAARQKRMNELDIRPLSAEQCEHYGAQWTEVQRRFVDDPTGAVIDADGLVKEVMRTRGYPVGNFEQRIADLSVEHANVVDHYRAARTLALASEQGQADTEDLRQAMVHYRALFSDLLQSQPAVQRPVTSTRAAVAPVEQQRLSRA